MANDDLDSFLKKASNYHGGAPEYYEDTHDEFGNYRGGARSMAQSDQAVGCNRRTLRRSSRTNRRTLRRNRLFETRRHRAQSAK